LTTLANVVDSLEKSERHTGRLRFFAELSPTLPLSSVKTTGSISVERVAKPLKNQVATKDERNHLSTDKRTILLRVGLNLRLKTKSIRARKAALGKVDLDNVLVYE
jgi:hypothetical protein